MNLTYFSSSNITTSVALIASLLVPPVQQHLKTSTRSLTRPVQFQYGASKKLGIIELATSPTGHLLKLCSRVVSCADLPDNWDGYGGVAPSKQAMGNALDFIMQIDPYFLQYLRDEDIVPNPYGTISFEWSNARKDSVCVEIGDVEIAFFYTIGSSEVKSEDNRSFPDAASLDSIESAIGQLVNYNESSRNSA